MLVFAVSHPMVPFYRGHLLVLAALGLVTIVAASLVNGILRYVDRGCDWRTVGKSIGVFVVLLTLASHACYLWYPIAQKRPECPRPCMVDECQDECEQQRQRLEDVLDDAIES